MKDGRWQMGMADGRWRKQMADGGWQMKECTSLAINNGTSCQKKNNELFKT
jgi:hypothetical protein